MASDGLVGAAASGVRLDALRALRDELARDYVSCDSLRDKAALSQRLMDCLKQIEECEKAAPQKKGTALDEFTKRRQSK